MQKFDIEHPSIEQITSHLTADAVWHNMPAEPASGADAVRRAMEPSMSWSWRGFEIVHQVVQGNVVLNERIDRFEAEGTLVEIGVCGVFEIREGKVAVWRDYFDMATVEKQASRLAG